MYDYKQKDKNLKVSNAYMLAKTLSMFEWDGLPDSLPTVELERLLQTAGYAFLTKHDEKLYAFTGGLGGELDVYGRPTQIIVTNPALKLNKTFNLETDGVLILSDSMCMGLMPIFDKYNTMLVENDISMMMYGFNSRMQKLISASDDRTKASADEYVKKTLAGDIAVIGENAMFDGLKVHGGSSTTTAPITSLIEFHQYLKSLMFNEIGLGQNHNMKRERLVTAEVEQIRDSIYPLVYDMMKQRLKAVEKLNALYGMSVTVDFGSVWNVNIKSFVDDVVETNSEGTPGTDTPTPASDEPGDERGTASNTPDPIPQPDASEVDDEDGDTKGSSDGSDNSGAENSVETTVDVQEEVTPPVEPESEEDEQ